ncbi:ABC transporter permease [Bacillus sp. FJAT-28004]|jgi:putative aldouronate transport system permease protein|uniref:ABC transporter permease n=1 Tax=Bacillus sp. FJAT-28004 TaxID=1679165 RepID=UPI0006B4E1F0|nr:ABC transporter permease subunit [Bacillus sp. FJAT-28004]
MAQVVKKRGLSSGLIYHFMLLPGMIMLFIFSIIPMFGAVMAFQRFIPAKGIWGSDWVGLANFTYMFQLPDSKQIFINTIVIAVGKILLGLLVPIVFALLLNEVRLKVFKSAVQTIVYLPHFMSWVVLGTMLSMIFSYDGMVNGLLEFLGLEPIMFLASNTWFRPLLILTDTWKEFGYGTIIYLAALTAINPALYESAALDGANRWRQIRSITLPGIFPTIVLLGTLSLGNVLNAGFDQVFNLYNPLVYETGDIIDTFVYRMGLINMQYSFATAIGLMKSVISFVLIILSYKLAAKYAGYKIF